jgi:hypothetical protein
MKENINQVSMKWCFHYVKCENEKVPNVAHNLPLYMGSLEMVYKLRWR